MIDSLRVSRTGALLLAALSMLQPLAAQTRERGPRATRDEECAVRLDGPESRNVEDRRGQRTGGRGLVVGRTAQASGRGRLNVVQLLVARGADVNARVRVDRVFERPNGAQGGEWRTPLNMARRGGHGAVVAYLLSVGARE